MGIFVKVLLVIFSTNTSPVLFFRSGEVEERTEQQKDIRSRYMVSEMIFFDIFHRIQFNMGAFAIFPSALKSRRNSSKGASGKVGGGNITWGRKKPFRERLRAI